jgi:type I restriction enzyme S subunit
MASWKSKPLSEVCQFINRGISPAYIEVGGVAVLNQKCVRDHAVNFDLGRRHDTAAKKVTSDRFIRAGDVLVNSTGTGTLGRVAQLREDPAELTTVDSHVTIVRPTEELFYPEFFGYALVAIEEQIQEGGEGCGGQTELSRAKLAEGYVVSFPKNLNDQRRIVAILDEAFDSIATAKANTEKNLQNAREVFEAALQINFGQALDGFEPTTLGAVCRFIGGSQPPKSEFLSEPRDDCVRLIQIRDYKSDKNAVYIPKGLAKRFCAADDVMIGRYGPPLFQILRGLDGAYNVALMKAAPDEAVLSKSYLFYFLRHRNMLDYIIASSARAAGQIGLNKETIEPYPIYVPALGAQAAIVNRIEQLEGATKGMLRLYEQKLAALDELKKSLLHQAFTGQLTAKKADELVEAVA